MVSPRWNKVIRDLWGNKLRTLLVVLAIAVGVFAFGVVATSRDAMLRELGNAYLATNPAHIRMSLSPFDEDLIQAVEGMREVALAEGRATYTVSMELEPGTWISLRLWAIDDFENQQINIVSSESGKWPPARREILLERSIQMIPEYRPGDTVRVELPDGQEHLLPVAGLAHDVSLFPSQYYQEGYGFITFDTLEWLTGSRQYDELYILVEEGADDRAQLERTATLIRERIERDGYVVLNTTIPDPGKHWNTDGSSAMILILGVLGVFSLFLSGFLVLNTVTAILKQQVRQIGMMKAIGGKTGQVMGIYLINILVFGVLAFLIAVPLGAAGAQGFAQLSADMANYDIQTFSVRPGVIIIQAAMSVLLPLIVSVVPVLIGTRITAREALSDYGLPTSVGSLSGSDESRLYAWLPRPMVLSLRNAFRRKGRMVLTLITLTLAGSIFISIFSVRVGLRAQFARLFDLYNYDLGVVLAEPIRTERIEREAFRVAGVVGVEGWNVSEAQYLRSDGSEGENLALYAVPPESAYIIPHVEQGRWLYPDDQNAVVVLGDFLTNNPNLDIGSEITLKIKGQEELWVIIGALPQLNDPTNDGFIYVNQEYYGRLFGMSGSANYAVVETVADSVAGEYQILRDLEDHFKQVGIGVAHSQSVGQVLASTNSVLNVAVVMMLVMALLLALVGGLGLAGTMSLNVIERTREIGVMRAIGASNRAVWGIVVVEGVLTGLISAFLGSILAIPMSYVLANGVGVAMMGVPLQYRYSLVGVGLWLGLSISLAALASFLPARNAVRLSVRETLAYE